MTTRLLWTVLMAGVVAGLAKSPERAGLSGTLATDPQPLGNGTARAYLTLDDGQAVEVGVALSEGTLDGLSHDMVELIFELPAENPTPYRHVAVGWNPQGHPPTGTYDLPHFDFHFFTISDAERMRIDNADPLFATKAANYPGSAYIPRGYVAPWTEKGVPRMGVHWVDPSSPELNGEVFSHTFIYGSWDGRMTFAEPMVARSFLKSRVDVIDDIPVAQRHHVPGQYPSQYRIQFDSTTNEHRVALVGFASPELRITR